MKNPPYPADMEIRPNGDGGSRSLKRPPAPVVTEKKEKKMHKRFLPVTLILAFFAWGCASMQAKESPPQGTQAAASKPTITDSYASNQLRLGDTWRVYIKASDPNNDMDTILATIEQPGKGGAYPPSYTRIKDGNKRELSGYLYWNTSQEVQSQGLNFTNLVLTVQVKDKAGNVSNPVRFPLHFSLSAVQQPPPAGAFQNRDLGPIMIRVTPPGEKD